jgi:FkbM family methyltransferase
MLWSELARRVALTAWDVGARGGVGGDLQRVAAGTRMVGFEPDAEECARLNAAVRRDGRWLACRFLPTALADHERGLDLHITAQPGCSSALEPLPDAGRAFGREAYYKIERTVRVPSATVDGVVAAEPDLAPDFLKLDVQGLETRVFAGGRRALAETVVGVRCEVAFTPTYAGQPTFADVDAALRPFGFVPMRWLETHAWRRDSKAKLPRLADGPLPYSRGQLMHADVLYLRTPETLEPARSAKLALIALCYDHLDIARSLLTGPAAQAPAFGADLDIALQRLSRSSVRPPIRARLRRAWTRFRPGTTC